MGGWRQVNDGFTIIEVMIVLAVTGIMLVSAILLISGRQNKTEFATSIRSLQQQLQQVINETSSGYYPNNGNFKCVAGGTGASPTLQVGSNAQGSNGGCIFLGKVLQFGLSGTDGDASSLGVLPVVGNQNNNGASILTLADSQPRAVYPLGTEPGSIKSAVSTGIMQYGLTVATSNGQCGSASLGGICYQNGGVWYKGGALAVLAGDSTGNIAQSDASGSGLASSTPQFALWNVKGSVPAESYAALANAMGISNGAGNFQAADKAYICIASGTTNQSGLLTISGNGSLSVTLNIMENTTCA